jgi:putative thiamine transport system substrate-binding protein
MTLIRRRQLLAAATALPLLPRVAPAQTADWSRIEAAARGKTVYFNAWAGSQRINAYLQWVAAEVLQRHGIKLRAREGLRHGRGGAPRARGESRGPHRRRLGRPGVDQRRELPAMKREGLLFGPFAKRCRPTPSGRDRQADHARGLLGTRGRHGSALGHGPAHVLCRPQPRAAAAASWAELLDWARRNPGRFTYPAPPAFHGTTFLKQVLLETTADRKPLLCALACRRLRRGHRAVVDRARRAASAPVARRVASSPRATP